MKVSTKVQKIVGTLSRMRSLSVLFSVEDHFFLQKGNIIFVTFIHIYRKCHISMYFLTKIVFHFPSEEKIPNFPEKNTIALDNRRKIIFQCYFFFFFFLERPFFPGIWRKYHISCIFLRKIIFHFPSKEKIYFPEKKPPSL